MSLHIDDVGCIINASIHLLCPCRGGTTSVRLFYRTQCTNFYGRVGVKCKKNDVYKGARLIT